MSRLDALAKSNDQAMAAFSDEVVAKLGRLEMFTDKAIRTQSDEMEKRLKEQEKLIGTTRTILILVLLMNILIAAGTYLVWSGKDEAMSPTEQVQSDTTDTLMTPIEKQQEAGKRKR